MKTMTIEIWSDIVCPFCYIGKRRLEAALAQFEHKEQIQVIWKSFQLDPNHDSRKAISLQEVLMAKGFSSEKAKTLNEQATLMAEQVGLTYRLDQAKYVNTFNAHRFIHFAKQVEKQEEAEECLFAAYFTHGKNIDDTDSLLELGQAIGLDTLQLSEALANDSFYDEVRTDIYEAQHLGISAVPFFVLNRKYGISGAQAPETFLKNMQIAFEEWRKENPLTSQEII